MIKYFEKNIIKQIVKKLSVKLKSVDQETIARQKDNLLSSCQSVGFGVRLKGNSFIFHYPKSIIIGNNVHIENKAFFSAAGGLIIGDNTHISRNVTIYTINNNSEGTALPYDQNAIHKPVTIGKNVWIGMNVSISPGVTRGEGAIIGIGTVVNRDIEPFEIVGSAKTTKIKNRNIEHYNELDKNKKYGGADGKLIAPEYVENFYKSYNENKNRPIVFVLGTGRSGSTSIVNILNQHPDCKAFHEDIRQLIRLSTQLAYKKNNGKVEEELNNIFNTKVWNASDGQLIVHSDQRLWNFVPFLSEYFPNSKFLHLVREPKATIKSMVARNWYQKDEYFKFNQNQWAMYRLQGNQVGDIELQAWDKMSNLEKCTWYWYYINQNIQKDLLQLRKERTLTIKLEELPGKLPEINEFLELELFKFEPVVSNKRKQAHNKNYEQLETENIDETIQNELKKYNYTFY